MKIKDPEFIDFIIYFFEFALIALLAVAFGPSAMIIAFLVMKYLEPASKHHGTFGILSVYVVGIILFVWTIFLWWYLVTTLLGIPWSSEG